VEAVRRGQIVLLICRKKGKKIKGGVKKVLNPEGIPGVRSIVSQKGANPKRDRGGKATPKKAVRVVLGQTVKSKDLLFENGPSKRKKRWGACCNYFGGPHEGAGGDS